MTEEASNHRPRQLLRRPQASVYVQETHNQPLSEATLATLATRGGGPIFSKAGNTVLYDVADLDAWAIGRLSRRVGSTSELRQSEAAATA